jgi:hypothetical protein
MVKSLNEFLVHVDETRALVTLRTDVEIPFLELGTERVAQDVEPMVSMEDEPMAEPIRTKCDGNHGGPPCADHECWARDDTKPIEAPDVSNAASRAASGDVLGPSALNGGDSGRASQALAVVPEPEVLAPSQYERQLDPRSLKEARMLATDMFASKLFSAYGTPQGVLSTVMLGRELGLPAMASLRSVHVIEGRHALSAALMVTLVLKSGFADISSRCPR